MYPRDMTRVVLTYMVSLDGDEGSSSRYICVVGKPLKAGHLLD